MAEMTELTSEAELRELLGTPTRRTATKVRHVLPAGTANGSPPPRSA